MATQTVNLDGYITRFNGRIGTFKKGVLLKLFGAVVKDTPVLTGRLRANWTFSKGAPQFAEHQFIHDTSQAIASEIRSEVTADDESYFLANNMPYVNRIEYEGHSHTKAPDGMVRLNLVRIAGLLAEEAAKTK